MYILHIMEYIHIYIYIYVYINGVEKVEVKNAGIISISLSPLLRLELFSSNCLVLWHSRAQWPVAHVRPGKNPAPTVKDSPRPSNLKFTVDSPFVDSFICD